MRHNDSVASNLKERNMSGETNKSWKILIDEIRSQMEHKGLWEIEIGVESRMREIQLFGYDCRISALAELGSKLFGVNKSKIMNCANGKDTTPPNQSNP